MLDASARKVTLQHWPKDLPPSLTMNRPDVSSQPALVVAPSCSRVPTLRMLQHIL
jgi:hypothetical protein